MERKPPSATPRPSVAVDGGKIRALRKARGLEVAGFAEMIGCTRAHVANVELGHRTRVSADTFDRICEVLGISPRQRWRIKAGRTSEQAVA